VLDIDVKKRQGDFSLEAAFETDGAGVTALFGHSGAGKTTLINLIAGLLRPDTGHIQVNGRTLFDSQRGINVPPEKRRVGYVFQDSRLFPHFSVKTNLTYGMNRLSPSERYIDYHQVVDLLGIGPLLKRGPATLSGGEKQRIAIGRALLASPMLLLLDEPLASLDAARKSEVLPFVGRLPQELSIPIIYVTHSVDEILNLSDYMVFLDSGRLIAADRIENVTTRPEFRRLTGQGQGGTIISTCVTSHDRTAGLTHLGFEGGSFKVPLLDKQIGSTLRVRIRPQDVALALEPPLRTSFQNIFPGRVETIEHDNRGYAYVGLNIGHLLLIQITSIACAELQLEPGKSAFALIKSISVSVGKRLILRGMDG
jgi:molybdate transport system ATP-binding protein